ncbi:MAG: aminotransferase class I/II-fold pyridoxal phosphate-dependent enzyme [Gemmatimonadaceae bacterium]
MPVSRRSFLSTVGAGSAGLIASPLINWRGHEALFSQEPHAGPTAAERRAERLLAARPGMIRIDSNENPNGPGHHVFDAISSHFAGSNRYPTQGEEDLKDKIAKVQGIPAANILLGCGSGEILRTAVQAFTSPTKALVAADPTFESPATFAKILGNPIVAPKVDSKLRLDLDGMADGARNAGLVYFCNPNNPTATVHSKSDVLAYIDRVNKASPNTIILVDEAYHEYVEDPSYGSVMQTAITNPRVIVTRTFSKVFGMAGLRIGYAVAHPDTLAKMVPWMLGSGTNHLALVAAGVAITDSAHIADEQKKNRDARAFTKNFFESAGYTVAAADANFLMVDIRRDPKGFKTECLKHMIAVGRAFPALPTYARISIGTMPEMKKAVAVFRTVLATSVSTSHGQ